MTKSLFLEDSYLKEMEATILETSQENNRWKIVLDKTVFYPMGGGQPTDQGELFAGNWRAKVSQALLKEDKIVHYVEGEPPPVNTVVKGAIDWDRRYLCGGLCALPFGALAKSVDAFQGGSREKAGDLLPRGYREGLRA